MDHIIYKAGEIDYRRYHAYVESIKEKLPPHDYLDLTSHSSLHDAWLESVTIREHGSG